MGNLALCLLGGFRAELDGVPATTFESDKARGLLAYLAVEARQAHRREKLAGLFWPEKSDQARHSLSQALYNLRTTFKRETSGGVVYLLLDADTVSLNPASIWVDTAEFSGLVQTSARHEHLTLESCLPCHERLLQAGARYQGEFLAGFSDCDSDAFEKWCLSAREHFQHQARSVFDGLLAYHQTHASMPRPCRLPTGWLLWSLLMKTPAAR